MEIFLGLSLDKSEYFAKILVSAIRIPTVGAQ